MGAVAAYGQSSPSARGGFKHHLSVSGEYSTFKPDYGSSRLTGAGIVGDYGLTTKLDLEAVARFLGHFADQNQNETQNSYLAGLRYRAFRYRDFSFYAKGLVGGVWIEFPKDIGDGSYFAFAPGGAVQYKFSRKWSARADYEYEVLPSAPNIPVGLQNGLTPNGFSFGVTYRVF